MSIFVHPDYSMREYYKHRIGNKGCRDGWCGSSYPCKCNCGGLIHADFGDENYDGNYWLYIRCDKCGESE